MRFSPRAFALLCTVCIFASTAQAKDDGHDKDRATLTADYILVDTAYENKDTDGVVAFLAEDWIDVDNKGEQSKDSKKDTHDQFAQLLPLAGKVTSHTVVDSVVFEKGNAQVTFTYDITIPLTRDGVTKTLTNKSTERDTWVQSGDTWQIKQTTEVVERVAFDGKSIH